MANENNILPPNDPDLLLAKRIGDVLPDLKTLDTEKDSFLNDLFNYKRSVEERNMETINSVDLWDSIETRINESGSESIKGRILNFTPAIRRFAIAASILIAAIVGSFLLQDQAQPTLIGESFASISEVALTDGSTVSLRPYSKIYLLKESESEMSYKLEGEAYFDITSDPQRIFSVVTDQSKVQVLGTKFILSEWGNTANVYLEEGQIKFESLRSGSFVVLEPGQSSIIDVNAVSPEVTVKDPEVFTDWLTNELTFNNDRVRDIFNELEQHFNIRIQGPDSIENETLSGSIELDEIDAVLRDFELVLGGSFTRTDSNTYEFNAES
ncbi:MAG: FecR domain-containing protein [Gracilimonas sp.]|nr:FecR domain-containing protein [Gracilimonas sp.]